MKRIVMTLLIVPVLSFVLGQTVTVAQDNTRDQTKAERRVHSLRVLILSTMLADEGIGEWGFAVLVEADGHRILFDTGYHPDTVLKNARELGVDLSSVQEVVLSHNHEDHTGGLL